MNKSQFILPSEERRKEAGEKLSILLDNGIIDIFDYTIYSLGLEMIRCEIEKNENK